jgi:small multidrug resistance family-3 protein
MSVPFGSVLAWLVFLLAAAFEVLGDAVIRKGLRGRGVLLIALGFFMLGCYGLVVNRVPWDFSRLLGVYVGVFATFGVLYGRFVLGERVPLSTWLGLAIVVAGGLVIQFGEGKLR